MKRWKAYFAAIVDLLDLSGGGIYLVAPDRQSAQLVCARGLPKDFPGARAS